MLLTYLLSGRKKNESLDSCIVYSRSHVAKVGKKMFYFRKLLSRSSFSAALGDRRFSKKCLEFRLSYSKGSADRKYCSSSVLRASQFADRIVRSPFNDITIRDVTIDELLLSNVDKWPDYVAVVRIKYFYTALPNWISNSKMSSTAPFLGRTVETCAFVGG